MPPLAAPAAPNLPLDRRRPRLGRGIVVRPRLIDAVDDPGAVVTVVSAPAGSGKTTLLLSGVEAGAHELPIAWLSAHPGLDGHAFWAAALAAVAEVAEVADAD